MKNHLSSGQHAFRIGVARLAGLPKISELGERRHVRTRMALRHPLDRGESLVVTDAAVNVGRDHQRPDSRRAG